MKKGIFIIFSRDNHKIIERSGKKMIKILDDVKKMGICDLAHNCMFIKNGSAWYRNFSEEMPLHDLIRTLIKHHVPKDSEIVEKMNEEELCEYITEIYGGYLDGWESIEFVLAAFYHMAWGFAEVREELKECEKEQIEQQKIAEGIEKIADYYGADHQMDKTIEECAELIQAIAKLKCNDDINILEDVVEEMADVQIMLDELVYSLDCEEDMKKVIEYKVKRQLKRIQEEKERKEFCNE